MPYVKRDELNRVVGIFAIPQFKGQEFLEDGHPDLVFVETAEEAQRKTEAQVDSMDRLFFEVMFNHESRVRVLEGKPQVTKARFRDELIDMYKRKAGDG
jgi:hypothetical protein